MHKFTLHTSDVLKDIQSRLSETLLEEEIDVFVYNRPTASKKQRNEMVVVALPSQLNDLGVSQTCRIGLEVIVKNTNEGLTKIGRLESLCSTICESLPINGLQGRYTLHSPEMHFGGQDKLGYTVWRLQATLIINTSDDYEV